MSTKIKWIIIFANLALVIALFINAVVKKEATLKNGKLLLLELAPVDPRSLIQGDYMALDYAISRDFENDNNIRKNGFIIVTTDSTNVAVKVRIQDKIQPLNSTEWAIPYKRNGSWTVSIGAQSYFFEEGKARKFEDAKYGGVMVDRKGNLILEGMYDANRKKIAP